jgi:glutamate synthase (NADPH/NADH) large chain
MGNDAALPVLSKKPKLIYNYFKQLFAQVTNPPIDPIREELVMSLVTFIGPKPNLLAVDETKPTTRLETSQPVLTLDDLEQLKNISKLTKDAYKSLVLDITYDVKGLKKDDAYGMKKAIDTLRQDAHKAVKDGYNILILSDRNQSKDRIAIPALLATSATHQYLVREGLRTNTGLVVDTGSAREVHHFALLGGYGAEAICPWLAYESMHAMTTDHAVAQKNFIKSISKGLYKVMSKMGISTYQSYCGAQIFEAVGLNSQLINAYFKGTATNVEGIGIEEIAEETMRIHNSAFGSDPVLAHALDAGGEYAFRIRGEEHMWTPDSIAKLQHATRTNQYNTYKEYAALINDQTKRQMTLRGLFKLKTNDKAISIDEVEPAKEIVKRFVTGAMSLGSISTEAHTTLAIAMNRIGGKSNTGEGGEDAKRFLTLDQDNTVANVIGLNLIESDIKLKKGDSLRSRIKQVASGRFGVTAEYLSSADQI